MVCIAITSAIGRIMFGKLSDLKWVNSIFLQQVRSLMISIKLNRILITIFGLAFVRGYRSCIDSDTVHEELCGTFGVDFDHGIV